MNRILKTIGISMITLILSATICFAENKSPKQVIDSESINNSIDKNDVLKVYDDNEGKSKDLIMQSEKIKVHGINKDRVTKAYKFNVGNIVSAYKKEDNFGKLISNKYVWLAPIIDTNQKQVSIATMDKGITVDEFNKLSLKFKTQQDKEQMLAEVKKNEGKWILAKISADISEEQFDFISDSSKIEKVLLDNNITNPSQIKFVLAESHATNILYIKDGNKEYGIPYCARPEFYGLTNGKLYNITEIVDALGKASLSTDNDSHLSGGAAGNSDINKSNTNAIIIVIISVLSISLLFMIVRTRKSLKSK